jgi:hypothetical protein
MTVLEINGYGTGGVSEKSTCWTVPETNQERYANRNNTGLIGIKTDSGAWTQINLN